MPEKDHYNILNLPSRDEALDEKTLRTAYRRALLLHHPDKSAVNAKSKPSIDDITLAYKTLANPLSRSEYDRLRALDSPPKSPFHQKPNFGLEIVDLDDLSYDPNQGTWYRSCRCGKEQSFVITEETLQVNADYGEIIVGCEGCSLWLRVTFAVAEEE